MNPTVDACLRSWPWEPWLLTACLVSAVIYLRGWLLLRHRDPLRWREGHVTAFVGGLAALYLALASPIEPLASLLLQAHMVQHLLLMMVAPPLVWLSAPLFPLLRGLPRSVVTFWLAPILSSRRLQRLATGLTHPAAALAVLTGATWLWHIPPAYELALRSTGWHYVQHLCFLAAGVLFWYPVVRPYPGRPRWSLWLLMPYLILADVQNTLLSAWLTFSSAPLYAYYAQVPRLGNITPVDDQAAAGVIMWVPGSLVFLAPLFAIGLRLLYGQASGTRERAGKVRNRGVLRPARKATLPARLRVPLAGALSVFLRWRHARTALQLPLLLLAAIVIYDGLAGPQASPLNLAGVLPWVHWRGLVVLGLLAVGNLSCMACPFTLPRRLAGRWLPRSHDWPQRLRSKWLAVALIALFLWSYEVFSLWDNPWGTAWIAVGYFAAALAVDGFFRGAAFCKYVCPIGQFNFVQSLVSPLEVAVRDQQVCTTCRTKDCIRGRADLPGCELDLFQPRKSGNMDCTFCLDCVRACPHENVGFVANLPGRQLWHDRLRSGIGRLSARGDIAALVAVLTFGAFANAAGMVAPIVQCEEDLCSAAGLSMPSIVTLYYLASIIIAPVAALTLASVASRRWAGLSASRVGLAMRYAYCLVPLGFGMWLAHYSFHLLTGYDAVVPVAQRFAADLGVPSLGQPQWNCGCCAPPADWLLKAELLFLDFGLLSSLYTVYRFAVADCPRPTRALRAMLPWSLLIVLLFSFGVWIVFQPMQMRGTMMVGG
jgi:cytochrome c oxidase assembly factor CtaG/polyferredoxin